MNKNQRIAYMLDFISKEFHSIGNQMEEIRKILLEKDTVIATTTPISPEAQLITKAAKRASTCRSDNAGRGTWGAAKAASNRGEDWKENMTAEMNENNLKNIERIAEQSAKSFKKAIKDEDAVVGDRNWYDHIYAQTTDLTLIHRSRNRSRYYKIRFGVSRGCVIQVNDKTSEKVKDGRYNGISIRTSSFTYVATVTCDADGKDYVNRVLRPLLTKNQKIVRMYRPKGHAGHFTHCDVYVAQRYYTKP